jgi:putative regulator of septum formation
MGALADRGTGGKGTPDGEGADGKRSQDGLAPGSASEQHRRPRRRTLLIAWVAAGTCLAAAAAAVTVALVAHRPQPVAVVPPHPLRGTVFQLRPGQCANIEINGVTVASVIPCARPHGAEIYGVFRVADRRWPGPAALARQARAGCMSRLSGYLNPQLATPGLTESYVYPNQGAWDAGARSVVCEIRDSNGQLTGSVRAAR